MKFKINLLCASLIAAFVVAEIVARSIGNTPWQYRENDGHSAIHEVHPVLGWRLKENSTLLLPSFDPEKPDITYTFLKDGMRKSNTSQGNAPDHRPKLIIVGGSYAQGYGLPDHESLGWQIQDRVPNLEILNYAVGAYGTYQSLLRLQDAITHLDNTKIAIYGFIQHHESRNVAMPGWVRMLTWYSGRHFEVPYALSQPDGTLAYGKERYPTWPFRNKLALVPVMEDAWFNFKNSGRSSLMRETTERLILDMRKTCEAENITFYVVLLEGDDEWKKHYSEFLNNNEINVITFPFNVPHERRIPGDGHPDGIHNARWADYLSGAIPMLSAANDPSKN
ncbi:MAG: hypothetical protein AAF591_21170 [Verrucomicrobiota bacterium]